MPQLLSHSPAYRQVRAAVLLPLVAAVPFVVLLLIARRAAGALEQPLPGVTLVSCGLLLAVWSVAVGSVLQDRGGREQTWRSVHLWLPPVTLAAAWLALLVPGSSPLGLAGLTALLVVAEAVVWGRGHLGNLERATRRQVRSPPRLVDREPADMPGGTPAENVSAQFVRQREPDGRDALRGQSRADFAAGQRTAPVHVAFCPPLAGTPQCEAEQVDGPAASVRVAQALPYGVRFDVKLDVAAPVAQSVWIEWAAIEAAGPTEPERPEA